MQNKKGWLSTAAAVVVGAICFVGAKQLTSSGVSSAQRALTPKAEVERMLDERASADPMLGALSEAFPAEWGAMRAELANDIKSSISSTEVERRAHARSRAFMTSRASSTASAPNASLVAVANAEALLIAQLQRENEQACADFAMRGIQPGSTLSQTAVDLIGRAARARVFATREGIDSPISRRAASDDDWGAVLDAMEARGATAEHLGAFSNPSAATAEQQCASGVYLYQAVASLSEEQAATVFAEMTVEAAKKPAS